MANNKRIVEIGGVKMEIDLRHCKTVESYHVGDAVKVLVKGYSDYSAYIGMIVGFDNFENRPAIEIAYVDSGYSEASIKFITYHKDSKDLEICPIADADELRLGYNDFLKNFNSKIELKERELADAIRARDTFQTKFKSVFVQDPDAAISNAC